MSLQTTLAILASTNAIGTVMVSLDRATLTLCYLVYAFQAKCFLLYYVGGALTFQVFLTLELSLAIKSATGCIGGVLRLLCKRQYVIS